tara:strand:+ start:181 stop:606 length:426 start_codon:yes stop_codon:yes gene_type:complete
MKKNSKSYIAILDNALVEFLPQKAQYEVLRSYLNKNKINLSLYITEDENTYLKSSQLIKKINSKPKIDGFIFFSLLQISFSPKQNIEIIQKLLKHKYEIIFYKENIRIKNYKDFLKIKKHILLFRQNNTKNIDRLKSLLVF